MTSSVDKQSKAAPISETFSGILSLFASGDFSEIWNGVEQLATGYSEYYPFMVKTLSDQRSNGFEKLGLLLSFRRHFKELYYENEPIPEYDADFLKALLDLSVSETPLLKNNARILLRTKPTAKTKEQFDTYFERMTDIEKKKRLAGVAADLYYNFAIETAFDKKDDGSNELELSPKSQNVDLAIDALSQAWSFRDKGLPQDTSLFVKALYGRGLILTMRGARELRNDLSSEATKSLALAEQTFDLFLQEAKEVRNYDHPKQILAAGKCRKSNAPSADEIEVCFSETVR